MYPGIHAPYPYHHYGMNMCPPYEMIEPLPLPDINAYAPPSYYPYRRGVPYVDYPGYDYIPRPPVIQTNVRNDVSYYLDDPYDVYDDPYRLSRSKVQLVDLVPKTRPTRNPNRMVVSTFQPRERRETERVLVPRTNAAPSYDRQRRMRLMPLYHSADPQYVVPNRRRSLVREIIPVATVANPHDNRQTIRVRSLSPL
jgi:hypothetical protein